MRPDPNDFTCWRDPRHTAISTTVFGWPMCDFCRAAPPYHERPQYLSDDFVLGIYVPTGPATVMIAPRSGVVGLPDGGDGDEARTEVYFEGWVNGAMQYADRDVRGQWQAGIEHAASRMVCRYPTVATALLCPAMLQYVGLYWPATKQIAIDNNEVLNGWLA